jgi:hypothetical protein
VTKGSTIKCAVSDKEALERATTPCLPEFDDGYKFRPEKDPDKVLNMNWSAGNELARACESGWMHVGHRVPG